MTASGRGIATALGALAAAMLAGVVHIVSLLAMPALAPDDAYARVARFVGENVAKVLPRVGGADDPLPGRDPSATTTICRYDLADGPVRVSASFGDAAYAALSLHGRTGVAYYGLNDRAGSEGRLEIVVMTAAQIAAAAAHDAPGDPVRDVRVEAPGPLGFVSVDVLPRIAGSADPARSTRCALEAQP